MTTEYMRRYIADAYPGPKWADRVKKMSDAQVYATYMRLTNPRKK